jgi:hypothetical protein
MRELRSGLDFPNTLADDRYGSNFSVQLRQQAAISGRSNEDLREQTQANLAQ